MNIVFFGASKFVIPILEVLKNNFNLVLVVTTEHSAEESVPKYCIKNSISYISIEQFSNETIEKLKNIKAPLAVLAYFGLILPEEILNIFPKGILNIHPSLLPKYRGPTPGQSAILDGENKTGVTLIKLDAEIDHGLMLDQIEEKILPNDTSETLYDRLFKIGAKMLEKNVPLYINEKIELKEQNHKTATFTERLTRKSGFFDIANSPSKEKLDRMIRAFYPWPGVWTKLKIRGSTPGVGAQKIIKFLPEKKIQVEGKKPMSYKDFINGYRDSLGVMLNLFQHLERSEILNQAQDNKNYNAAV